MAGFRRVRLWIAIPLIAALIVAGWLGYVHVKGEMEAATRSGCMSNLRQIALAMSEYAVEHEGNYPESFAELLKGGYIPTTRVFFCRKSRLRVPEGFPDDFMNADLADLKCIDEIGDYLMVPGMDEDVRPDFIILYERPANHGYEGLYVVYGDGHPKWLTVDEFCRQLAAQCRQLKRPSRKGQP